MSDKIYCANCKNCKVFMKKFDDGFVKRVKCSKNQWLDKDGFEKFYRHDTIDRRTTNVCKHYDSMGSIEKGGFLYNLKRNLSITDKLYDRTKNAGYEERLVERN